MMRLIGRLLQGLFLIALLFALVNFLYWNMGKESLGYPMVFAFHIPPYLYLNSDPLPVGFLILAAFCLGMLMAILMGFFRSLEKRSDIRSRDRRIKELEQRLREKDESLTTSPSF